MLFDIQEAISVHGDLERLLHIQKAIKELPTPHFRTLKYLTKHLAYLATLSTQTNMHTRNLALVWAPNLLRSKDVEGSSGNGDMAFQEVRKQQSVVEFILNHTDQIFSGDCLQIKPNEGPSLACGEKYATLPISGECGPMKLMSLEEAQARSLSPHHPLHKERQRENSLPDTGTATLYHTVIDISDNKRKFSGKSKRWKSIFNLGRSVDSKGKLSRNGSVFIRAQGIMEKAALRPSRSMESLCSLPADDDRGGSNTPAGGSSSIFIPDVKSRTLGSDFLYDLSEPEQSWEFKGKKAGGATGGWSPGTNQKDSPGASAALPKTLPEQLKVFKGDDISSYKPTSPKNRRMLYSGSSQSSSSRPSFPGSFFPLESSPRHQRRAVNISEPFAVSVPLRVSAVISSNSTPCRAHSKDKAAPPKVCKEPSEQSSNSGKSNTFPKLEPKKQEETAKTNPEVLTSRGSPQDSSKEVIRANQRGRSICELEGQWRENKRVLPSPGKDVHKQPSNAQLDEKSLTGKAAWSDVQELKITEPGIDLLDETFKPAFTSCGSTKLSMDVKSKRSRSSPSLSLLCRENSSNTSLTAVGSDPKKKQPSESDLLFYLRKNVDSANTQSLRSADKLDGKQKLLRPKFPPVSKDNPAPATPIQLSLKETSLDRAINHLTLEDAPQVTSFSGTESTDRTSQKQGIPQEEKESCLDGAKRSVIPALEAGQRLSVCLEEKRLTLELSHQDDEEGSGGNLEELELVESWEDLNSTNQWVTSPLHSPDVEEFFNQLSGFSLNGEALIFQVSPSADGDNQSLGKSTENLSGYLPQNPSADPDLKTSQFTSAPSHMSSNSSNMTQQQMVKGSTPKQRNTVSSQRFNRQVSHEAAASEKREETRPSKHRPYSLNLDLGHRCIRDISNQQNRNSSEFSSSPRGLPESCGAVSKGHSELDLFLNDRQAPLRRNSAPVSVSSVRTAFMIKTCQAKAVPVVPPKVQYSQIPQSRQENHLNSAKRQEKESAKTSAETCNAAPLSKISNLKEELENKKPSPKQPKHPNVDKSADSVKTSSPPELSAIIRRQTPSLEVFVDVPRPNRGNVLQRPSFRNRQRPQSLILLSPPFPIMDYPPSGDDGKLLSSMKSLNETSAVNVFSRELGETFRTPEGIALQNKMTIPKSGQRLETSTSCFYQPQRRSMIFDSRSQRQIE